MLKETDIEKSLYYMEPGPVVLVTSLDGRKKNVMTFSWTGCRLIHAFADGTFSYDGERVSHRELMADKLPPGL